MANDLNTVAGCETERDEVDALIIASRGGADFSIEGFSYKGSQEFTSLMKYRSWLSARISIIGGGIFERIQIQGLDSTDLSDD